MRERPVPGRGEPAFNGDGARGGDGVNAPGDVPGSDDGQGVASLSLDSIGSPPNQKPRCCGAELGCP